MFSTEGQPQGGTTEIVGMAGVLCGLTSIRCARQTPSILATDMLGGDAASNPQYCRRRFWRTLQHVCWKF
jgi:hypothetical protein